MAIKVKQPPFTDDDGYQWEILEEMPYGVGVDIRDLVNANIGKDARLISDATNMIMLLGCTKKWGYGDDPIDEEHVRALPKRIVTPVIREMVILYYDFDPDADDEDQTQREEELAAADADSKKD